MLECMFISVKRLKSKKGTEFNLATFVLNGDLFKVIINDNLYSQIQNLESGSNVVLTYELSIWSENLNVNINSVELAS